MFTPDALSFAKIRKGLIPVNFPSFNKSVSFKVSEDTLFIDLRQMIFESFGMVTTSSRDLFSFRVVFGDSPGQRKFFYDPSFCDKVLNMLTNQLSQGHAIGNVYLYLIDLHTESTFSKKPKSIPNGGIPYSNMKTNFGYGATEWMPYGPVGNTSFIDLNVVTVNPAPVATTVKSTNESNYYNPYMNNIFVPLTCITNGAGGSGNEMITIATPSVCPSIEQEFTNEVYNKAIKYGKLWKYQQTRDMWREVICILDQQRLWFHTSPLENSSSDTGGSGKGTTTSAGTPSGAVSTSNVAAALHLHKAPMSYIDLDVQTDAVVGDFISAEAAGAATKPASAFGRFFGSNSTPSSPAPATTTGAGAGAGTGGTGTSTGTGTGTTGAPTSTTNFHVTYNQNRQVIRLKAASERIANEWIDAITLRDSIVVTPLLSSENHKSATGSSSDTTVTEEAAVLEGGLSQSQVLSGLQSHMNDNAEILQAEQFIARNESQHNFRVDFALLKHLSTFSGMLSYTFMREAFEQHLVFSTLGKRKVNAYLFRFWCYAEDYYRGHPCSKAPYDSSSVRGGCGGTCADNGQKETSAAGLNSALADSLVSEGEVAGVRRWAEGIYRDFIDRKGTQCIFADEPDYPPLVGAIGDAIRLSLYPSLARATSPAKAKKGLFSTLSGIMKKDSAPGDNATTTTNSSDTKEETEAVSSPCMDAADADADADADAGALPPWDMFRQLQQVVLGILSGDIYTSFTSAKDYKTKVLLPAVHAYERQKQGRNVVSSVEDWNFAQTELIDPKADGESRERTTTVGNLAVSGANVNINVNSAPTSVPLTGTRSSVSPNNSRRSSHGALVPGVPPSEPTFAGSRRLHRWFLADNKTSAVITPDSANFLTRNLQARTQRRASKVGPISSANNKERPLSDLLAKFVLALPVDVDSGDGTVPTEHLPTPWRGGFSTSISLPGAALALDPASAPYTRTASIQSADSSFSFGFLPPLWFAFVDYKGVMTTASKDVTSVPKATSVTDVVDKLASKCRTIEELLKSGKISRTSRLVAASSENPLMLMLHTTIPSVSAGTKTYLRNNVICSHINQYCRRYHRRAYRATRELAYLVDHVLHLIPYYRRLKVTMKPLGALKAASVSGRASVTAVTPVTVVTAVTPAKEKETRTSSEGEAAEGTEMGVKGGNKEGGSTDTSSPPPGVDDLKIQTTPVMVRDVSSTPASPLPNTSTSGTSTVPSADVEHLLHALIATVLHSNTCNFTLPYHGLPGVVIMVTAARCRYTQSNQRYFGKYHTVHSVNASGAPCESLITINQDTHYGIGYNSGNQTELNFRCVVVLVEFYGRGYLYMYDSTGFICLSIVHISNLTKVSCGVLLLVLLL